MDRKWLLLASEKVRRWPLTNAKNTRKHRIRGKTYLALAHVQIPILCFYPDTPNNVVWMDPT